MHRSWWKMDPCLADKCICRPWACSLPGLCQGLVENYHIESQRQVARVSVHPWVRRPPRSLQPEEETMFMWMRTRIHAEDERIGVWDPTGATFFVFVQQRLNRYQKAVRCGHNFYGYNRVSDLLSQDRNNRQCKAQGKRKFFDNRDPKCLDSLLSGESQSMNIRTTCRPTIMSLHRTRTDAKKFIRDWLN